MQAQTTIKIPMSVKNRFFTFKEGKPSGKMLTEMIDFFERNGISPSRNVGDPASELRAIKETLSKEHVRIIKLLNAYDRDYFKPLSRFLEIEGNKAKRNAVAVADISEEEVREMVALNNAQRERIAHLEGELQKREMERKQEAAPRPSDDHLRGKFEHLKTRLHDFHESKTEDQRNPNRLYFDAAVLQRFHRETMNDLNDLINGL